MIRLAVLLLLLTGCRTFPQPGEMSDVGYDSPRLHTRAGATYDGNWNRIQGDERAAAFVYEFDVGQIDAKEARRLRWMGVGMAFDVASTEAGLARGCVELNPLAHHPVARVALKAPGLWWYYRDAKKSSLGNSTSPKLAWWLFGVNVAAGVHNLSIDC